VLTPAVIELQAWYDPLMAASVMAKSFGGVHVDPGVTLKP
jgi:hypothetical protein